MLVNLSLFYLTQAKADIFVKYGVGVLESAKYNIAETKHLSVGFSKTLDYFIYQVETGVWADSRTEKGRGSSLYGGGSAGLHIGIGQLYTECLWGGVLISHTDGYLGGNFQFNQDLGIGVTNRGAGIGLGYKHISSAGIYNPNIGRDFIYIKLIFPIH